MYLYISAFRRVVCRPTHHHNNICLAEQSIDRSLYLADFKPRWLKSIASKKKQNLKIIIILFLISLGAQLT